MRRLLALFLFITLAIQGCSNSKRFRVTFDSNGGSNIKELYIKEGSTIILPEPIKEGHYFNGWYTGQTFMYEFTMSTPVNQNITLYAKWWLNSYKLTLVDENYIYNEQNVLFGNNISLNPIIKSGYDFIGWYEYITDNNPFSLSTMPARDIRLYARWEPKSYSAKLIMNNGSNDIDVQIKLNGQIDDLCNPTKVGYIFDGWYYNQDFSSKFTTMPAYNVTLYAKWNADPNTIVIKNKGDLLKVVDSIPKNNYSSISKSNYPEGGQFYMISLLNNDSLFVTEDNKLHYMHKIKTSQGDGYIDMYGTYGSLDKSTFSIRISNGKSTSSYPYSDGKIFNFDLLDVNLTNLKFNYYTNNCNIDEQVMIQSLKDYGNEAISSFRDFVINIINLNFK